MNLLGSFLAMMGVVFALAVVPAVLVAALRRKPLPSGREVVFSGLVAMGIAAVATVGIGFALDRLVFSGFFFRPTTVDHGIVAELGLEPEPVSFASADGTRLHGWFLRHSEPGPARAIVVHLHGSDLNITATTRNVAWLTGHGYDVFAFDYRGYGQSEGTPSRLGVIEDAVAAVEFVRSPPAAEGRPIVLFGQSMGGQLAIHAAVRGGPQRIAAVISDATYGSPRRHTAEKVAGMAPSWLIHWAIWLVGSDAHAAEDRVAEVSPISLLLTHGTDDAVVHPDQSNRLFERAAEPRELWSYPGGGHLSIFRDAGAQERLLDWLDGILGAGEAAQPRDSSSG